MVPIMMVELLTNSIIREWCNGNTTDFDSVILGSSPSSRAKLSRLSIMDNTVGFYPTNVGSIPAGETKLRMLTANFIH
jgi:hypothetical protein